MSDNLYCCNEISGNFFLAYLEFFNSWHLDFEIKSNVAHLGTNKNKKELKLLNITNSNNKIGGNPKVRPCVTGTSPVLDYN